jgi:malate dehydrogenase (oxaloacetate-decarboxylating)
MDYGKVALEKHKEWKGKIEISLRAAVDNDEALSIAYTPGVAAPCLEIPGKWSVSRTLRTEAAREDGSLVLSSLPAGGWCVVQLAIPASTRRRFSCP